MNRSYINQIIQSAIDFLTNEKFYLPKWSYWKYSEEWQRIIAKNEKSEEEKKSKEEGQKSESDSNSLDAYQEIMDGEMGWDITDFGRGNFQKFGLVLFTIRNGSIASEKIIENENEKKEGDKKCQKTYCEKVMLVREGQKTPMHFHWNKMEDIICRGGIGNLAIQLYNAMQSPENPTLHEALDEKTQVVVSIDGVERKVNAGATIILTPGESITLPPYLYHTFWADGGDCLIGEVSLVNDDNSDNRFEEPLGRFPSIVEDVEPTYLLTKDYRKFLLGEEEASGGKKAGK